MNYFFNIICEEIGITGGKIIHIDENRGNIKDVFEIILENYEKISKRKMGIISYEN